MAKRGLGWGGTKTKMKERERGLKGRSGEGKGSDKDLASERLSIDFDSADPSSRQDPCDI